MAVTKVRPGTSANPPRVQPGGVPKGVVSATTPKIPKGPTKVGQVGTPGGTLPKNPTEGQTYTGSGGVHWQYNTAKGGWVRVPVAPGTVTTQSRPSVTPSIADGASTSAPSTTTTTTTIAFKPDASWWSKQFGGSERYLREAPLLRAKEEGTAASYGYRVTRNALGQPVFRSKGTGASGITQALDENGNPVVVINDKGTPVFQYRDASGKTYAPEDLEMDIQRIERGKAGYLEGALGAAEAGSEKRQFDIGDVASQRTGVRRSGMRASAAGQESQALQDALANLIRRATGEFSGIQGEYRNLYDQIYGDLLKSAAATPGTEVTIPGTGATAPTTTTLPGGTYGQSVTVGAGGALSPGAGGEFMKVVSNATLERNTNDKQIRQNLQNILDNPAFKLTAQQRRYIQSLITGRYKGNKKY